MRPHHFIHVTGIVALVTVVTSAVLAFTNPTTQAGSPVGAIETPSAPTPAEIVEEPQPAEEPQKMAKLGLPIANAQNRVTKKTFGMEIHPDTSPVAGDRFNGYHVGVDFETSEDEQAIDVPIFAICDGPLLTKSYAGGYGGYALQSCELEGEPITVIYGHMDLNSIKLNVKDPLARGQMIGVLGEGYSHETDGVRKHLHLGIHRGSATDIRGYVQKTGEIGQWLDALPYLQP